MNDIVAPVAQPAITHPFPELPASATTIEVVPGLHWLRMPLPFALDHINLWLLEDGDGWTVVDTGMLLDEVKDYWQTLFGGVMAGRPVKRVIVTHFHPDHIGLAGWLVAERETELWISRTEWLMHMMLCFDETGHIHDRQVELYQENGLGEEWTSQMTGHGNPYRRRVSQAPMAYTRIADGDEIDIGGRAWRVIVGTGHAPEHACLYCAEAGVLISGDQILPKITPNISLWASDQDANPLGDYLGSLDRFRDLPAETLVLPSHNLPFRGLATRLDQLAHHHDDRLARIIEECAEPRTGADIVPVLFRRQLDVHQIAFAMGESLAHLAYLRRLGRLATTRSGNGAIAYHRTGG